EPSSSGKCRYSAQSTLENLSHLLNLENLRRIGGTGKMRGGELMVRELRSRRILITGASSGIGRDLSELAARLGARVAITARSGEPLGGQAGGLAAAGAVVLPVPADITVAADRRRLLDEVAARWGGLDALINNAGVGATGHFIDCPEPILRQVM